VFLCDDAFIIIIILTSPNFSPRLLESVQNSAESPRNFRAVKAAK